MKKTTIIIGILIVLLIILAGMYFLKKPAINQSNDFRNLENIPPVINYSQNPPLESIEACGGKLEGDACEFEINERTMQGNCKQSNDTMICTLNQSNFRKPQ